MDSKNIEKIYMFTSKNEATGQTLPEEVTIFLEDGTTYKEDYDISKHDALVQAFLHQKGIDMANANYLEKSRGIFEIHPVGSAEHKEAEQLVKYNIVTEDEEDLSQIKKDHTLSKGQKIAAGVVAGAAIPASIGVAAIVNASSEAKTDENISKVDELLNELPTDNERRIFFETVDTALSELNTLTLDKEVFALEEDKDAVLEFTTDEIISAMIVLNNYSRDELKEIFGDKELNSDQILSNYQDFAFKMSIYAMNGKAPSTISKLIRNEENRTWFETIENAIVKFNRKQTNENADKLIRLFAYFYQHGINGTDNLENDEASLNGVKNLALNMMRGYYDANTQAEYRKYLVVSTAPSDFDDKYRENELAQIQKGEKLKFYLDEAEKGVCTISVIEEHIKATIDNLEEGIDEISKIKLELVEAVSDAGEIELAKNILDDGLSDEVLALFETSNKKAKKALDLYRDSLSAIDYSMPSYDEVKTAIDEGHAPFEEVKDDVLYNNRIRGLEKINEISNSGNVITKEQWNNMSSEEKIEYAKENGTVVSTTTQTKEEKVEYEDLTPSEKQEADKQKEQIKEEVQIGEEIYKGDTTEAAKQGFKDATNYAEEVGAYKHADVYNKVNPKYPTKVPTNGTLSNIAQVAYAFNNETITINDSQIQKRFASDVETYKKTTSDSKMIEAYKSAWISAMNQKLSSARAAGKELRAQAEEEYKKAQESTDKKNEPTTKKDEETTTKKEESTTKKEETTTKKEETTTKKEETTKDETPVVTEKPDENKVDPNLNPSIADSDEGFEDIYDEDYDGYISSDESDDVFAYYADEIIEETTTKVLKK